MSRITPDEARDILSRLDGGHPKLEALAAIPRIGSDPLKPCDGMWVKFPVRLFLGMLTSEDCPFGWDTVQVQYATPPEPLKGLRRGTCGFSYGGGLIGTTYTGWLDLVEKARREFGEVTVLNPNDWNWATQ